MVEFCVWVCTAYSLLVQSQSWIYPYSSLHKARAIKRHLSMLVINMANLTAWGNIRTFQKSLGCLFTI
jgi:hypothetical protein